MCGGTLITNQHVLSAAHCFVGVLSPSNYVRLGDRDISTTNDGDTALDIPIKRSVTHEGYSAAALQNDIAVVIMDQSVAFRPGIRPACLPYQVTICF